MQAALHQADRISLISVSSTAKVSAEAEKLRRAGVDVVDFGVGEPDFPTPDNIKRAAIAALDANFTRYTAMQGVQELRQAICDRHHKDFGTNYAVNECVVTVGGKHAIFNLVQALVNPGDEVVIPVQTEYYALEGLSQLLGTIELVRERLQPNLKIMGAVLTLFDRRNRLAQQVVNEVRAHFPGPVFETVIPRSVRLAEAPSYGKSILDFDALSKGARAYKSIAREIVAREGGE